MMPLIWRSMRSDGTKPQIGRGPQFLGVRVGTGSNDDVNPDDEGCVHPGRGGMSVAPNPDWLPTHRQPRRLRDRYPDRFPDAAGSNGLHCWHLGEGPFHAQNVSDRLFLRLDPNAPTRHGLVEPEEKMTLADYEGALAATQDLWHSWEE
jgi:hypothetical protein